MATISTDTSDRELIVTRLLKAPRELVFKVWTDPAHIDQWWGPRGFANTTHAMQVTPGGIWRFNMHGPDGRDWRNKIVYSEVVAPEKLVYSHGADDDGAAHFQVTVTFEDRGEQTLLTMHSVFPSVDALEAVKKFGAVEGGRQTIDRLEEYLVQF